MDAVVENLEPGVNYTWRMAVDAAAGRMVSPLVSLRAPGLPGRHGRTSSAPDTAAAAMTRATTWMAAAMLSLMASIAQGQLSVTVRDISPDRSTNTDPDGASGGRVNGIGVDAATPGAPLRRQRVRRPVAQQRQRRHVGASRRPRADGDVGHRSGSVELEPPLRDLVLRRPRHQPRRHQRQHRRRRDMDASGERGAAGRLLRSPTPGARSRRPSASPSTPPTPTGSSSAPTAAWP